MNQQAAAAPAGLVDGSCRTVSPDSRQDCVNSWIQSHLIAPGTVGGCGGVSPDRQSCLNALVVQAQHNQLDQQPIDPQPLGPAVGTTCSSVGPAHLQECINSFVLNMQAAQNGQGVGAVCADSDQSCIDSFVLAMQTRSGVLGGCAGVAPDYQQACINNFVLSLQQKGVGVGAQAPQTVFVCNNTQCHH
jgi:hypothetical protein